MRTGITRKQYENKNEDARLSVWRRLVVIWTVFVLLALSIASALMLTTRRAKAAGLNCSAIASGNWSSPSTWSCSGVPGAVPGVGDTVFITNFVVSLDDNVTVQNVDLAGISQDVRLTGPGNLTITGTFNMTDQGFTGPGTLTINSGALLRGSGMPNAGQIGRTIINHGTVCSDANCDLVNDVMRVDFVNEPGITNFGTLAISGNPNNPGANRIGAVSNANGATAVLQHYTIAGSVSNSGTLKLTNMTLDTTASYAQSGSTSSTTFAKVTALPAPSPQPLIFAAGHVFLELHSGFTSIKASEVKNSGATIHQPAEQRDIDGDFTQEAGGTYSIELTTGSEFSPRCLFVTGAVNLAGTLNVVPTGGLDPTGKQFVVMHYMNGRTGTFSNLTY